MPKDSQSRPHHYLVTVNDIETGRGTYPADLIFQALMDAGIWEVGDRAGHMRNLKPGDRLVFYMGGDKRGYLVGTATVISRPHPISDDDPPPVSGEPIPFMAMWFRIGRARVWRKPRPIRPLLAELSFIEARLMPYWGLYFRNAIRRVTEHDFEVMAGKAR